MEETYTTTKTATNQSYQNIRADEPAQNTEKNHRTRHFMGTHSFVLIFFRMDGAAGGAVEIIGVVKSREGRGRERLAFQKQVLCAVLCGVCCGSYESLVGFESRGRMQIFRNVAAEIKRQGGIGENHLSGSKFFVRYGGKLVGDAVSRWQGLKVKVEFGFLEGGC